MEIGLSHLANNNLPLALKELLGAYQLDPKNSLICNNLGIVYFMRDRYDLASKYFNEAIVLNPKFTDAKNNLARVNIEQKNYAKANSLLNEVLSDLTYTNSDSAHYNFGLLYFEQKKYAQAKTHFAKVIRNGRQGCLAHVYYARSFMEASLVKQASTLLDRARPICTAETQDEAHFYSAIAMYRLGNKQQSLLRFQETTQTFPQGKNFVKATQMIELIQKELR